MKLTWFKKFKNKKNLIISLSIFFLLGIVLFCFYFFSYAKIIFYPKERLESVNLVVEIGSQANKETASGEIIRIEKQGEKKVLPTGEKTVLEKASGEVTIINNLEEEIPLAKQTRLLSKEGILFRMIDRATIPAKGKKEVRVESDKQGEGENLEPTKFTIPGLGENLEKSVWGESYSKMSSGVKKEIFEKDIEQAKQELAEELYEKGLEESEYLKKNKELKEEIIKKKIVESLSSAEKGMIVSDFTIKVKIEMDIIFFNKEEILKISRSKLESILFSERRLKEVNQESLKCLLKSYDFPSQKAFLDVSLEGRSQIKESSSIFKKENLKNKTKKELLNYFENTAELERVEVFFSPFWTKRVPGISKHIEIEFR